MTTKFERKFIPDNDTQKPDNTDVIDSPFFAKQQREGIEMVSEVDLQRARDIVMASDAASTNKEINPEAYLPTRKDASETPIPLYIRAQSKEGKLQETNSVAVMDDRIESAAPAIEHTAAMQKPLKSETIEQGTPATPELKMTDCPVAEITPETAPIIANWYDRVFDRAVKYLDQARDYFNPKPEPSEKVLALREQRRKLHESAANLFTKDKTQSERAKQEFLGTEINLAGKKYTIENYLSKGGFGATFTARDEHNKKCVVKVSAPFDRSDMFYKQTDPTNDEKIKATAARAAILEVATLNRLSYVKNDQTDPTKSNARELNPNNPGPAIIDAQFVPHPDDINQRVSVIVMEYVQGSGLEQFAFEQRKNPLVIVDALIKLAAQFEDVHKSGIIHGDIKPANILVQRTGNEIQTRVIDFGTAVIESLKKAQSSNSDLQVTPTRLQRLLGRKLAQSPVYTQEAATLLSPSYAKVEESATPARDRYSFGRSIQRIIFGRDFNNQTRMQEITNTLPYPSLELARIAEQLTRKNPRERIKWDQVRKLLENLKTTESQIEAIQAEIPKE